MKKRIISNLPYIFSGALVTLIDQIIKKRAEKHPEEFRQVIKNRGFAGGRLANRQDIVRHTAVILTVYGMIRLFLLPDSTVSEKLSKTGWAVAMGGAVSNTYDRVKKHYVTDYIPGGKYVYNLGDFAIFAGLSAYIGGIFGSVKKGERNENSGSTDAYSVPCLGSRDRMLFKGSLRVR